MTQFDLSRYQITGPAVFRNPSPATLYQDAVRFERGTAISNTGALIAYSGKKTGRSPSDKRIVRSPASEKEVWWGPVNIPIDELSFHINRERAVDFLNTRERLYVVDGFAGWHPQHRLRIRIICARPYHALFMRTMLIRPTPEELDAFGEPDYVIFNAGEFPANRLTQGMTSKTSVDLSLEERELVILGTEYAGEMKKGVFTIMHYLMPKQGLLSMHCSATAEAETENSCLLFGLSGTGKTTLSADPQRRLVGDDEHVWGDDGIFNIEGGCYAKTADLTPESEPEIFHALHFGAVLENVVYDRDAHQVDFADTSFTPNTRGAYPIEFIRNAKVPCVAGHPTNIIFLTCDAFGVLPPVSKLSPAHAMYHFISGYTAKIAGTEEGVTEPAATFSACFGAPFLVWHPAKYAELLATKIKESGANVWLVNTGWTGGSYGAGSRIQLKFTRAIVDAINSGALAAAPKSRDPIFGLEVVTAVPNVPESLLVPEQSWSSPAAYRTAAAKLAGLFTENFAKFEAGASAEVKAAGPHA
jgi:phosphoenolpyruvate carboxykinase (ATP)